MDGYFLAPCHKGRVRWRGGDGFVRDWRGFDEEGGVPESGWGWWCRSQQSALFKAEAGLADRLAWLKEGKHKLRTAEIVGLGKGRLQGSGKQVTLNLAERSSGLVMVWDDLGLFWVVGPAAVMVPRYEKPTPLQMPARAGDGDIGEAVRWAGGILHSCTPLADLDWPRPVFSVQWSRFGQRVTSLVDDRLNVIRAGFCLSETDRVHDLVSLVSLQGQDD